MACAGDVPTLETMAAVDLLRRTLIELKVRVVNVVDLMTLQPKEDHPHGLGVGEIEGRATLDDDLKEPSHMLSGQDDSSVPGASMWPRRPRQGP